jgi:ISXO2 transposase-like protein
VHVGFAGAHETVKHKEGEYVRGGVIHTNTVEGYYSIFKRGMHGVYQHCSEKHLHRYLAEFDFRYSNRVALGIDDSARANNALKGIVGKRLTYRAAGRTAANEAPPF